MADVENLRTKLQDRYEVLEFLGLVKGTATDAYHWDIHECVAKADAIIAICDYPSIGLGYELGTAVEHLHKPVLALGQTDTRITRMVLGIDAPNYRFARYDSFDDVPKIVDEFMKNQYTN